MVILNWIPLSLLAAFSKSQVLNILDEIVACHRQACGNRDDRFSCACAEDTFMSKHGSSPRCIPITSVCDGKPDCRHTSSEDEANCFCKNDEFQCSYCHNAGGCIGTISQILHQCIDSHLLLDGREDCFNGKDENRSLHSCKHTERNGYLRCPPSPEEKAESCFSCPSDRPLRCDCNSEESMSCFGIGGICYSMNDTCDKKSDCIDSSDELYCKCSYDEFTCKCYTYKPPTCSFAQACIPLAWRNNGAYDCADGSDEIEHSKFKTLFCNANQVFTVRLTEPTDKLPHDFSDSRLCNITSCFKTPSVHCKNLLQCKQYQRICSTLCSKTSNNSCGPIIQCADGQLILRSDYCNGDTNCADSSDEVRNKPGFKCSASSCVLPQRNLHDDVLHCLDHSDLCFNGSKSCFECLTKPLIISSKQVCDGINDCYDLSDECLCKNNLEKPICKLMIELVGGSTTASYNRIENTTFGQDTLEKSIEQNNRVSLNDLFNKLTHDGNHRKRCQTSKGNFIYPTFCDGRPECRDFNDECECENPPAFCQDPCRKLLNSFFPLGDRYCDGIPDTVWQALNNSDCPEGFDERNCPKRLHCQPLADEWLVSIDKLQVCDGIIHCKEGEDEEQCTAEVNIHTLFSSQSEMIANVGLRSAFWIIGIIVIVGNGIAITAKAFHLKGTKLTGSLRCHHVIVTCISVADFLMGIYLLSIASFSASFSGRYGLVDHEFRSSLSCSFIGSLAVISSEASCFLMVVLTAFRLYHIQYPLTSMNSSTFPWKVGIILSWFFALLIALLPIAKQTFHYFVESIYFPVEFNREGTWNITTFQLFSRRFADYSGKAVNNDNTIWSSPNLFLKDYFPDQFPLKVFGYYGETSICMPRLYPSKGENAWEYTMLILTTNFVCFIFIAVGYVLIFFQSTQKSPQSRSSSFEDEDSVLQRRIARIIATDFLCWIPICVMAYMRIGGVEFDNIIYQISAVFLLPINSALNPFLYSSLPDKLAEKLQFWKKNSCS